MQRFFDSALQFPQSSEAEKVEHEPAVDRRTLAQRQKQAMAAGRRLREMGA